VYSLPFFTQLIAEPGHLPFGILPGGGAGQFNRLFIRQTARQIIRDLAHADGLHGRVLRRYIQRHQVPDFIQRALFHHVGKTLVDPGVQQWPFRVQHQAAGAQRIDDPWPATALKLDNRAAGGRNHFKRAQDALAMIATNREFHAVIAKAGRNPYYESLCLRLLDEGRRLLRMYYSSFDDQLPHQYVQEHEDLIEAIEARDIARADSLAAVHADQIVHQIQALIARDTRQHIEL